MDSNIILYGFISRFYVELNYGFIEADDGNCYFFFHDKKQYKTSEEAKAAHKFRAGDRVAFQAEYDEKGRTKACNVKFIQNEKRDKLIKEAEESNTLKGYLKKIDDDYFVKHINTYIFIPVKISEWETNLESIYQDRIDDLVLFELRNIKKPHSLYATLTDRLLKKEYALLEEQKFLKEPVYVRINGGNVGGYFCEFLDSQIKCYCKFIDEQDKAKNGNFPKGEIIAVFVKHISAERLMITTSFNA